MHTVRVCLLTFASVVAIIWGGIGVYAVRKKLDDKLAKAVRCEPDVQEDDRVGSLERGVQCLNRPVVKSGDFVVLLHALAVVLGSVVEPFHDWGGSSARAIHEAWDDHIRRALFVRTSF
jgi:hypothetical protein